MSEREPTRYDEEGKSLPERGSGREALEAAIAAREPEKLVIPMRAVGFLISLGLRTEPGAAWLDGFIAAHGDPSWVTPDHWKVEGRCPAEIVKNEPATNGKLPA